MSTPVTTQARPTRDPALDGLRGVAILFVFLFHYGGGLRAHSPVLRAVGYLTQSGWMGVNLFFALSGLLITGLLFDNLGKPHALRNFFARRALRIFPLYYAALLAAALAALIVGAHLIQLRPLLLYAGFLQNLPAFIPFAGPTPPPLPLYHLWSLAVEEQFYLLWAFLLPSGNPRRALLFCLSVFALSCLYRALVFATPHAPVDALSGSLPVRAGALALGGAVAMLRRTQPRWPLRTPALFTLITMLSALLVLGIRRGSFLLDDRLSFSALLPLVDVLSAALVLLSLQPGLWRRVIGAPVLAFLGRISYGFYMLHILLEPVFDRLGASLTHTHSGMRYQAARFLVALPITVAAAWLSFRFFETPFLRLKRSFPRSEVARS